MSTIREHGRTDFQIRVKEHFENRKRDYYSDYLIHRTAERNVKQPHATWRGKAEETGMQGADIRALDGSIKIRGF